MYNANIVNCKGIAMMNEQQAMNATFEAFSDDKQYAVVATFEQPTGDDHEVVTDWIDSDNWHSYIVTYYICERNADGTYTPFEMHRSLESIADAWCLYEHSTSNVFSRVLAVISA